jgi:hypothetical protein
MSCLDRLGTSNKCDDERQGHFTMSVDVHFVPIVLDSSRVSVRDVHGYIPVGMEDPNTLKRTQQSEIG